MRALTTAIALTIGLGFGAISAGSAAAAQTFDFKGACTDCAGTGTGVLTVQDYTSGPLTMANFVSFSYTSNLVQFTLGAGNIATITGNLNPGDGGRAYIDILQLGGTGWELDANADGTWSVSSQITRGLAGGGNGSSGGGGGGFSAPVIERVVNDFGDDFDFGADIDMIQPNLPSDDSTGGGVPEPASWALMLIGFGGLGATLRGRKAVLRVAA